MQIFLIETVVKDQVKVQSSLPVVSGGWVGAVEKVMFSFLIAICYFFFDFGFCCHKGEQKFSSKNFQKNHKASLSNLLPYLQGFVVNCVIFFDAGKSGDVESSHKKGTKCT